MYGFENNPSKHDSLVLTILYLGTIDHKKSNKDLSLVFKKSLHLITQQLETYLQNKV